MMRCWPMARNASPTGHLCSPGVRNWVRRSNQLQQLSESSPTTYFTRAPENVETLGTASKGEGFESCFAAGNRPRVEFSFVVAFARAG